MELRISRCTQRYLNCQNRRVFPKTITVYFRLFRSNGNVTCQNKIIITLDSECVEGKKRNIFRKFSRFEQIFFIIIYYLDMLSVLNRKPVLKSISRIVQRSLFENHEFQWKFYSTTNPHQVAILKEFKKPLVLESIGERCKLTAGKVSPVFFNLFDGANEIISQIFRLELRSNSAA